MIEKRRHKRVALAATAAIILHVEEGVRTVQTMVADISLSGVGVYSDDFIREGATLSIKIHFISRDGFLRTDSLSGNSVYVREIGDIFFVGIQFDDDINPMRQPFLYEHLKGLLDQN